MQRRLALLIATSHYNDPTLRQLRAPGRDASELAGVLGNAQIGGFAVQTLIDARYGELLEAIEAFCSGQGLDDQLLIYLSCHGVLDDRGRLYYAAADTWRHRLATTAVAATWLNERLEDCRARSQIVVLDCCHSGAFASGAKGQPDLALEQRFKPHGRGRIVLTASRSTEYSFEGAQPSGADVRSVFTQAIVDGLRSGEADCDRDGLITVTDAYHYVYDRVRAAEPRQSPELWTYGAEGDLLLAYSVRGAVIDPVPLPEDLRFTLESPRPRVRETGVVELAELLDVAQPGMAMSARHALQRISDQDIPRVASAAVVALKASQGTAAREVSKELAGRDQYERVQQQSQHVAERKAEEQTRQEATTRPRAEFATPADMGVRPRDMTIQKDGFERGLAFLAYLVPIVALIALFRRDSFVRVNAIQALMLDAAGIIVPTVTIGPAYQNLHGKNVPALPQPWFSILIAFGIFALFASVALILFCLIRVAEGRMPRISYLTRLSCKMGNRDPAKGS